MESGFANLDTFDLLDEWEESNEAPRIVQAKATLRQMLLASLAYETIEAEEV